MFLTAFVTTFSDCLTYHSISCRSTICCYCRLHTRWHTGHSGCRYIWGHRAIQTGERQENTCWAQRMRTLRSIGKKQGKSLLSMASFSHEPESTEFRISVCMQHARSCRYNNLRARFKSALRRQKWRASENSKSALRSHDREFERSSWIPRESRSKSSRWPSSGWRASSLVARTRPRLSGTC